MVRMLTTMGEWKKCLEEAGGKPVIVDFTASWCGPCKMIGPEFEKLAKEYGSKLIFVKVDVDENDECAGACGIKAMPTFQVWKDGEKVGEMVGADKAKLLELIKNHL